MVRNTNNGSRRQKHAVKSHQDFTSAFVSPKYLLECPPSYSRGKASPFALYWVRASLQVIRRDSNTEAATPEMEPMCDDATFQRVTCQDQLHLQSESFAKLEFKNAKQRAPTIDSSVWVLEAGYLNERDIDRDVDSGTGHHFPSRTRRMVLVKQKYLSRNDGRGNSIDPIRVDIFCLHRCETACKGQHRNAPWVSLAAYVLLLICSLWLINTWRHSLIHAEPRFSEVALSYGRGWLEFSRCEKRI